MSGMTQPHYAHKRRRTRPAGSRKINIEFYRDPADGVFKALLD